MITSGQFHSPRALEEVFAFLANPQQFAPLMPDFESMTPQDETHFVLRIVIQAGPIQGHANLNMEARVTLPAGPVVYDGQATIAGSPLRLRLEFVPSAVENGTDVRWEGEVSLGGSLAMFAGGLLETTGRQNFERMEQRLKEHLGESGAAPQAGPPASEPDYEI